MRGFGSPGCDRQTVEPRGSHQHRRHSDGGVDLLVPVVDDAGLHQIYDPVADRLGMDPETLLLAECAGHRLGNRAEAKLDRRAVRDQPGDVIGDGAVARPHRPRRQFDRRSSGRHKHIDRRRLDRRVTMGPRQAGPAAKVGKSIPKPSPAGPRSTRSRTHSERSAGASQGRGRSVPRTGGWGIQGVRSRRPVTSR